MINDMPSVHLLTCITFHYVESRLPHLLKVCSQLPLLAGNVDVHVFTNTTDADEISNIELCFVGSSTKTCRFRINSSGDLPHPFFLTWAHKKVLREDFVNNTQYSHFMYIEDDILVKPDNFAYWLNAREALRSFGLIPSFFRVEKNDDGVWTSLDLMEKIDLRKTPMVLTSDNRRFINLKNPYQAMYLFDRQLALEHLAGPALNPDFGKWNIREKAAQGQTFVNVPSGFTARNVVPLDVGRLTINESCWVHHLTNNYTNDKTVKFGKLKMDSLVAHPRLARLLLMAARAKFRPATTQLNISAP